jgi:hypothetical protein
MSAEPHAVFIIRIAGRPGQAGVHQLRRLLKDLLRLHKFRALDIREEKDEHRPAPQSPAPLPEGETTS